MEQRIISTLRLFGLQGMAITLFELHTFLVVEPGGLKKHLNSKFELQEELPETQPVSISQVLNLLDTLQQQGIVAQQYGYFTLIKQTQLIQQRWQGHRYGVVRERLIRRYAWVLQYVPFVRGVGLAGSQALGLEKPGSDIDLLVITEPKFLWLARTAVTMVLQLFGIRRHGQFIANRFCLNHYIAGAKPLHEQNMYTALEYAKLRPLVYAGNIIEFQRKNKPWIQACFPNSVFGNVAATPTILFQKVLEGLFRNPVGRWIEQKLASLQRRRIHTEEFVVVRDDELSFHPNSKQEKLLDQFFATSIAE